MLSISITLIIITFFAFEMEFIYTFLIYLIKAQNVYATGTRCKDFKLNQFVIYIILKALW